VTKHYIILNPAAGHGASLKAFPQIESELIKLDMEYDVSQTEHPWHAAMLAHQAAIDGYDVVIAVGGDGTANEVINGLMKAKLSGVDPLPALGVLCAGRGNDFAFGAGIPIDIETGCQTLKDGYRSSIDVGYVEGGLFPEGRYFGNGVGIGFDAVVGFEALKFKPLSGFAAYIIAALKTVFLYDKAPQVEIILDDRTYLQPALMVSIMNGRRMGGGFMMAPNSEISDGLFDLCIAGDVSKMKIFPLIMQFIKGDQETHDAVVFDRGQKVTVTAQHNATLPAHGDGETLCKEGNQLKLELLHKQLEVVTLAPGR
jgi:YegS/Rv2252/BmrU family lipid kinase